MIVFVCPFCGRSFHPEEMRDELSIREALISGLCQECQDEVFGGAADAPV